MLTIPRILAILQVVLSAISFTNASPLAKRAAAQRDGGTVNMGPGTYPRATRLRNGQLLGCFTEISNGNNVLRVVRSTNNGASWDNPGWSVATRPSSEADLDNCFVHQLSNSDRVVAAFRNHDRGPSGYNNYRIGMSFSDNNGQDWSPLSTPVEIDIPGVNRGCWEPFMMDAIDGSLFMFYSRENDASDQDSILIRSTDGGSTWFGEQTISGADVTSRDGMIGAARLGDGSRDLIAVFETPAAPNVADTGIFSVTSADDGATWGNRRQVYRSSVACAGHNAPQVTYQGNTLVVSFMVNEDSCGAAAIKTVTSTDGGGSWGNKITAIDAPCQWPGELSTLR